MSRKTLVLLGLGAVALAAAAMIALEMLAAPDESAREPGAPPEPVTSP